MQNLTYRTCTTSDIDKILEFWGTATLGGSTNNREAIQIFLDHDAELFITVWDADVLVGTVIAAWDGWRAHFARLSVKPEYRRRGIARELVDRAEKLLVKRGAKRVYADILNDSPGAIDFWRSVGFTPNDVVEPFAKNL
ncbi:MAG: GNAT family N-acetyltransferase [Chloroflexi bacterium]|nr:GNAT family N-acetyltransferase [Chloroflexota bacterium]